MADTKRYPLFSNGSEFATWQYNNCEKCVKAVFYNEKRDIYPKYRCAIQRNIEEAAVCDGCGSKRDYEATHQRECPYKRTERKKCTKHRHRSADQSLNLFEIEINPK